MDCCVCPLLPFEMEYFFIKSVQICNCKLELSYKASAAVLYKMPSGVNNIIFAEIKSQMLHNYMG